MMFSVPRADLSFAEGARNRFFHDFHVAEPPQRVFERVSEPDLLDAWLADFRASRWLESGEGGPGALREVRLKTIAVHERVIAWEPGERFAFAIEKASLPILRHMVEDFRLEPSAGGTRVLWTIAYAPRLFARPLTPILRPRFARMFAAAAGNLAGT